MKPLICPNCGAEVYHQKFGTSSFICFNCETEVFQISLKRTYKTFEDGEERHTGIRDMESEISPEESSTGTKEE